MILPWIDIFYYYYFRCIYLLVLRIYDVISYLPSSFEYLRCDLIFTR